MVAPSDPQKRFGKLTARDMTSQPQLDTVWYIFSGTQLPDDFGDVRFGILYLPNLVENKMTSLNNKSQSGAMNVSKETI